MLFDIFLTILLVLLNGFFVAAEFSIVKVRYSQIKLKADQGNKFAKLSQGIIDHLDTYLSATQLGITLASLALGWIGEPIVSKIILNIVHLFNLNLDAETVHKFSLPIAFITITCLHIIFGELAPKSIAIRKAETTTLVISFPLKVFFILFKPFIWFMNSISNLFLRLIGIQPVGEHEIHSSEELQLLIKQSKDSGELEEENYEIIKNAFDFTDFEVKDIMKPRHEIFAIDCKQPVAEILHAINENGYSRIPVYQNSIDDIAGILYSKDFFKQYINESELDLKKILHPPLFVIETQKISTILKEFQKKHIHMAVVINEFGGTEGIVTMEDILEELVGEIQDEDDNERPIVEPKADDRYLVQATSNIDNINKFLEMPLPVSENYSTLSGLILYHLNRIPAPNEKITIHNYEMVVEKIQKRTILAVSLKQIPDNTKEEK